MSEEEWTQAEIQDCWRKEMDEFYSSNTDDYILYEASHGITGGKFGEQLVELRSLARVTPPRVAYELVMDKKFYQPDMCRKAHFGDAQVEAIIYANQSFQTLFKVENVEYRRGFYLADSMGAGKTRSLAGIALEHVLNENGSVKKVLWFTGFERNIAGIKAEWKHLHTRGVDVLTYYELMAHRKCECEESIVVTTYDEYANHREMVDFWLGDNFDGLVIFDDAHFMHGKDEGWNLSEEVKPPPVALQHKFRNARVVYSTGTGSSDISYLLWFQRLNLWGENRECPTEGDYEDFLKTLDRASIHMLTLQMKRRGVYLSRHIRYDKTNWIKRRADVDKDFEQVYDRCTQLLMLLYKYMNGNTERTQGSEHILEGERNSQYWDQCEQLCRQLIVSDRVQVARKYIRSVYTGDQSFVMCLEDTCAGHFKDFIKEFNWTRGFPFSPSAYMLRSIMLQSGIKLGCPKTYVKGEQDPVKIGPWTADDEAKADELYNDLWKQRYNDMACLAGFDESFEGSDEIARKRTRLDSCVGVEGVESFTTSKIWREDSVGAYLNTVENLQDPSNVTWSFESVKKKPSASGLARLFHELYPFLPINPVDAVANMQNVMAGKTGNTKRLHIADLTDRELCYAHIPSLNTWQLFEKPDRESSLEYFVNGEGCYATDIALISSKSAIGLALHADISFKNQRARHHMMLDFGRDPVVLLHQLGVAHRANEVVGATYLNIKSQFPGANVFVAQVFSRLKAMKSLLGGIWIAKHFYNNLCRDLYNSKAAQCLMDGIDKLYVEGGLELKDQMNMLNLTPNNMPYGTLKNRDLEEKVNFALKRLMYLPVGLQRSLKNSVFHEYHEKREHGNLFQRIISLDQKWFTRYSAWTILSDGEECKVAEITLDRCQYMGWQETGLQNEEIWKFMARCKDRPSGEEPLLAVVRKKSENGEVGAFFPFCRNEVMIPNSAFSDWLELNGGPFWVTWDNQVGKMSRNPNSCIEKRWCVHGVCSRELQDKRLRCLHKWGVQKFFYITNPNAHLLSLLATKKIRPGLGKFDWSSIPQGLFIGSDACQGDFKSLITLTLLENESLKPRFVTDECTYIETL